MMLATVIDYADVLGLWVLLCEKWRRGKQGYGLTRECGSLQVIDSRLLHDGLHLCIRIMGSLHARMDSSKQSTCMVKV